MRSPWWFVLLAGCGDVVEFDDAPAEDSPPSPDALVIDAADIDAPPDAPDIDAPPEPLPAGALFAFDGACPPGFAERIELANRYLRGHDGDATLGELGGAATHTHSIAAHMHTTAAAGTAHAHGVTWAAPAQVIDTAVGSSGGLSVTAGNHAHSAISGTGGGSHTHITAMAAAFTSGAAPTEPPFREIVLCEVTGAPTLVPSTALVLAASACSAGWTAQADSAQRLLRAHDLDGDVAELGGAAHAHAHGHNHGSFTSYSSHAHVVTSSAPSATVLHAVPGTLVVSPSTHTHIVTFTENHRHAVAVFAGNTSAANALPTYREVLTCRAPAPAPLPANALILVSGACPVGWTEAIAFRDRFLGGDDGDASPGEVGGGPHAHDAAHVHASDPTMSINYTLDSTTTNGGTLMVRDSGATGVATGGHAHTATFANADPHMHAFDSAAPAVSMEEPLPPYVEVVVCERP